MFNFVDDFLNRTTMYRLVLYVLLFFFVVALALSFFKLLPYAPADLLLSAVIITTVSWITNFVFARVFEAPANVESVYITALILFCIITPPQGNDYSQFLSLALWASIWSMASKYIFAIGKKHIFNPVAFAVTLTAFTINESASWWIGTMYMLPFVFIGGVLIVRKIRRVDLIFSFFIVAFVTIISFAFIKGTSPVIALYKTIVNSAFLFFAFVMLTEPLTTPPTKWFRVGYGALVGFLFVPAIHIGSLYSTPELALVIGNIFSYIVSPKEKLILCLKERVKVADNTYDFVFTNNRNFTFRPGQYMEWTLSHRDPDSRGNRRYFTIASSPTEKDVRIGVRFYPEPSSFKNRIAFLEKGDTIVASQCAGDFVLPDKKDQKIAFIAGGIGATPFRSMMKYLLDKNEKRPIIMLYSNKTISDIAYKDIFDSAESILGIKTIYAVTNSDKNEIQSGWPIVYGFIDAEMIKKEVPDYLERTFYISGPRSMVTTFEKILRDMGVTRSKIKTDFFPGFV